MTVYVDDLFEWTPRLPQVRRYGTTWCHMFSDESPEELHAFAERLGLYRPHGQSASVGLWRLHYDLTPALRAEAVRLGAKEATRGEVVDIRQRLRESGR